MQMIAFGLVHGRIELDQDLARFDGLSIAHMNCADHTGLERLNDFGAPARNNFS